MRTTNRTCHFLLLLFFCAHSYAQQHTYDMNPITPGFPQSADAKSLGSFDAASVDLSTGVANVKIPIYSISDGPIAQDISLFYNTGGIKVDEEASWVGLGWNLYAGANITREVKGIPDENYINYGGNNYTWIQNTLNDFETFSTCSGAGCPSPWVFVPNCGHFLVPCGGPSSSPRDLQPDLYTANINGQTVKFFFNYSVNSPVILNNNFNFKITYDGSSFTLIDEAGIKYFFDVNSTEKVFFLDVNTSNYTVNNKTYVDLNFLAYNALDMSSCDSYFQIGTALYPTRVKWNVTKIESPDGKYHLDYNYSDYKYSTINCGLTYNINKSTLTPTVYPLPDSPTFYGLGYSHTDFGVSLQETQSTYLAKRLTSITGTNGKITFEGNTTRTDIHTSYPQSNPAKQLDMIKIYDAANAELKRFTFAYANLAASPVDNNFPFTSQRLQLLSLTETGSDQASQKPPYQFSYDPTPLPVKYSCEQDFWGYYNGNGANTLQGTLYFYNNYSNTNLNDNVLWSQSYIYPVSLPGSGTPFAINGANRMPVLSNAKAGVLTQITYPTGGTQTFDYDLHTFCLDNDLTNRAAGGLRVKSITMGDGMDAAKDITTNYYYDYNSVTLPNSQKRSSGEVNFMPCFGRAAVDVFHTAQKKIYKIHSNNYAETVETSESRVFYREVKVEQVGKGYTVYKFDNLGTFGKSKDMNISGTYLVEKKKTGDPFTINNPLGNGPNYTISNNNISYESVNYPYSKETNTDWYNGTLREIDEYDVNNNMVYKKLMNYAVNTYAKYKTWECSPRMYTQTSSAPTIEWNSIQLFSYYYLSAWKVLTDETEYLFNPQYPNSVANAQVNTTTYTYGSNHKFVSSKSTIESSGRQLLESYKYVADYSNAGYLSVNPDGPSQALLNMHYKTNQLNAPVEQTIQQIKNGVSTLLGGAIYTYRDLANSVSNGVQTTNAPVCRALETYQLETTGPLSNVSPSALSQSGNNVTFTLDNNYKRRLVNEAFDSDGRLLQSKTEGGPSTSILYGYNKTMPIAQAFNAKSGEVAFTSFESEEVSAWAHTPANIISSDKRTGDKCYDIGPAPNGVNYALTYDQPGANINQTGKYVFSCWLKTPAGYTGGYLIAISNNGASLGNAYPGVAEAYMSTPISGTNNQWKYFSVVIDLGKIRSQAALAAPPSGPALSLRYFISNNTNQHVYVDDIRIRPFNSSMSTITAKPLIGITSQTDERNETQSYEYDVFLRPATTKDLDNNIIEKTNYHYRP